MHWLTKPQELLDEGASGPDKSGMDGLDHCVGGYVATCLEGSSNILSVRKEIDGRLQRIATAEVAYRKKQETFEIIQISGLRNSAVDPEAKAAVENVLKGISVFARMTQNHVMENRHLPKGIKAFRGTITGLVRNDDEVDLMRNGFSRFLPRYLRDCSREEFVGHIADAIGRFVEPSPEAVSPKAF
jgi:hypothetical protein